MTSQIHRLSTARGLGEAMRSMRPSLSPRNSTSFGDEMKAAVVPEAPRALARGSEPTRQNSVERRPDPVSASVAPRATAPAVPAKSSEVLDWANFNPVTHRACIGKDGRVVIEPVPAEILELRHLDSYAARSNRAAELASRGFIIDKAIDVDQWDAKKVMALRLAYGYTWVPNAGQANIEVAPGVATPAGTAYDPAAPPQGSILLPASQLSTRAT
jgi:hypothetical protein